MVLPDENSCKKTLLWDAQQLTVINEEPSARIIVEAGPGMGKTAVACARVASLIDQGIEPANIWLVSFTRTAVKEIRDRISDLVNDNHLASAVRISTVDSQVWYLRQGFDHVESHKLFGSYEANILRIIEMLQDNHEGLREYLDTMQHLIVDEAQDLVGDRSQLIFELIRKLPEACGVTVFTDSAQAIYGFAEDEIYKAEPIKNHLLNDPEFGFQEIPLSTIYRTDSDSLKTIFSVVREFVLDTSASGSDKYEIVLDSIKECADGALPDVPVKELAGKDDALILFRRRAEVLRVSSILREKNIQHRLRMSGLPIPVPGWLGHLFGTFTNPFIKEDEFHSLWVNRLQNMLLKVPDPADAWQLLLQLAGDRRQRIDLRLLRNLLARRQPPPELSIPELGTSGPILSTIHASKGREAPHVYLMLPDDVRGEEHEIDEEVRVLFVGATRGKETLHIGKGYKWPSKSIGEGGRAFRIFKNHRVQVEIGREDDVDLISPASRFLHSSAEAAQKSQDLMLTQNLRPRPAFSVYDPKDEFRYRIYPDDTTLIYPIASFTKSVNSDLFSICGEIREREGKGRFRPPDRIMHLYIIGVRTVAVPEDDPRIDLLYPPFSKTGIFLAPIISGFPTIPILRQRRRW